MQSALLLTVSTLIALSASLSIAPSLVDTSSGTRRLLLPRSNGSTPIQPTPLEGWPQAPYRAQIADDIYLVINQYLPQISSSLLPDVLTNISHITSTIEGEGKPSALVDNMQVFSSGHVKWPWSVQSWGLVSLRFPAVLAKENAALPNITNEMAVQVLEATWKLEQKNGPRGFSFATVEVGGKPWSKFSLWIYP